MKKLPPLSEKRLLALRKLIFDMASKTPGVGALEETLKWDSPSYLTSETQSGTTIRINRIGSQTGMYGIFVHCQSNVVNEFKQKISAPLKFDSTRGIIFDAKDDIPKEVSYFIYLALTYHLRKKKGSTKVPSSSLRSFLYRSLVTPGLPAESHGASSSQESF